VARKEGLGCWSLCLKEHWQLLRAIPGKTVVQGACHSPGSPSSPCSLSSGALTLSFLIYFTKMHLILKKVRGTKCKPISLLGFWDIITSSLMGLFPTVNKALKTVLLSSFLFHSNPGSSPFLHHTPGWSDKSGKSLRCQMLFLGTGLEMIHMWWCLLGRGHLRSICFLQRNKELLRALLHFCLLAWIPPTPLSFFFWTRI
jgi:hypothetical protein